VNNNRTIWIVLLVLLLVLCFCCALTVSVFIIRGVNWGGNWFWGSRVEATDRSTQAVQVRGPVDLNLDVPVGNITVKVGGDDRVVVDATRRAWATNQASAQAILKRINITIEQAGNQVWVKATGLTDFSNTPRSPVVDVVVSVPLETAVTLNSRVGKVWVTGVRGDLLIKADVGEVTLTDVLPVERLEVRTRVANIELSGALAANARYNLTSDIGRISVRAPSNSAFSIDARSDIGGVNLGFALSDRSSRESFVGKEVRGNVGDNPTAHLQLYSRVGDISVRPKP
jgi:hypothetical protein